MSRVAEGEILRGRVKRDKIRLHGARRKRLRHYTALVLIAITAIIYLIPIYWIVTTSLKTSGDIHEKTPKIFLFRWTLDHYKALMPLEIHGITYVFIIEALVGILCFLLLLRNTAFMFRFAHIWNGVIVSTCIYAFVTTIRYSFLMLVIYAIVAYLLISPKKRPDLKRIRLFFGGYVILAVIASCLSLADSGSKYFHQLSNSIIIGFASTILAVALGTLTAYAFSRFKVAGKEDLLFFILSTRMLPPVVVVIPIYLMYSALGLRDTHFGLILLYTTFNVSFAVWLMKGFIDEIPKEYEDAALVDGYTRFQTFLKVVLPQSVTGIAATAVFCLITAWNEFVFALVLTEVGGKAVTAPPSIPSEIGSGGVEWGQIAAKTFVFLLPVAIFTFLMRSHLLRGVTFGAVKK
jgi:ABC-type glycerol-3-phosphate transport system permease component